MESTHDVVLDRFSAPARAVLASAEAEARALGHLHVGTEHLLLALVAPPPGGVTPLTPLLSSHGLDADEVVATIRAAAFHRSSSPVLGTIPYAPRMKKILELAVQEAGVSGGSWPGSGVQAGPEHLALAVLHEGESMACAVLERHKVRPAAIRALINGTAPVAPPEPAVLRGPVTPGTRRTAQLARERAGDGDVATHHLLTALLEEGEGVAARVLGRLGVTLDAVQEAVAATSATGTSDGPAASATVTLADGVEVRIDDPDLVARLQERDPTEVGEVVRRAIEQHLASGGGAATEPRG